MSWHPSRASERPLDPSAPTRYRAATVQSRTGRSMLVQLPDGHDRLLPVPAAPLPSLVGATVLLANDYDWVVAVEASDPVEQVEPIARGDDDVVDIRDVATRATASSDDEFDDDLREVDLQRFDRRLEHLQRRRHRERDRIPTFRKVTW